MSVYWGTCTLYETDVFVLSFWHFTILVLKAHAQNNALFPLDFDGCVSKYGMYKYLYAQF